MLVALVIDGIDQTIFQTFTSLDLAGYQNYDKALDVYYLSIAYTATLRNWTHHTAVAVGRFLYYFRLVGVVIFEVTQIRAVLLIFPNTFEYFFDFYEGVRARWDPRKLTKGLIVGAAAFIWIFIKLPQEWWIHVAQLDATDLIKTQIFGVAKDASWIDAIANRPLVIVALVIVLVVLAFVVRWLFTKRLPPADYPWTFDADKNQPPVDPARIEAVRRRLAERLFDRELVEKAALITLVIEALVRQGASWSSAVRQFTVMLAINLLIVAVGQVILASLTGRRLEHALVFASLITLIVTLYDRYR